MNFQKRLGSVMSAALALIIFGSASVRAISITTTSLPPALLLVPYSVTLQPSNAVAPLKWKLTSGKLPAGLTLNATTGKISGTPAKAGTNDFAVAVSSTASGAATQSLTLVVLDLFSAFSGQYNGLITSSGTPSNASSGKIRFTVQKNGSYTASFTLGGALGTLRGQFDADGLASNGVTVAGLPTQFLVAIDLTGANQVFGLVSNAAVAATLLTDLQPVHTASSPSLYRGSYNALMLPPDTTDTSVLPQGIGYGTLTVSLTGLGSFSGTLGDGTFFSASAPVTDDGTMPVYSALYANKGAVIGWLVIDTNGVFDAGLNWFKPLGPANKFFSAGFATNVEAIGSLQIAPAFGGPAIGGNYQVILGAGNLPGVFPTNIVENVTITNSGKVTVNSANTEKLAVTLTPATGLFTGSFLHPVTHRSTSFTGRFLQADLEGGGWFNGTNQTGFVLITSPPPLQ